MTNNYPPNILEVSPVDSANLPDQPVLFDTIETPEIPATLLPGLFGEFARALATATETAEALSVMTILGVISTCVAKRFTVSPKEGWQEPINIYTLIALPSANNKSLVMRTCTLPLVEWEQEQAALLETTIKRQRSERKNQEKHIESLRIKASKEEDQTKQKQWFREINDLEMELLEPTVIPQLFTNDATPESLAHNVYEQGGRLAVFSDEGGILETLGGLYNHGAANIDILLKGIDGGEVRVRRKDRSFNLNPYLTLVLAVQPVVISHLGEKRAYCGNGALERFLYVLPKSHLGYRTHDKPPLSATLQQAYHAKIKALLHYHSQDQKSTQVLTLSPSAQQAWHTFQLRIEAQLRSDGKLAVCLGWGGKICGFALRLAGLLHVAMAEEQDRVISEESMQRALDIAERLTEHAIAAYSLLGTDQTIEDAKEVLAWIKERGVSLFTQTEVLTALRNRKVGKSERLQKALRVLIERNILTAQRLPTPRKATLEYYVHPTLLKQTA